MFERFLRMFRLDDSSHDPMAETLEFLERAIEQAEAEGSPDEAERLRQKRKSLSRKMVEVG